MLRLLSEFRVKFFRIKGNTKPNQLIKPPRPLHDLITSGRIASANKKPEKLTVPERMVLGFLVYKSDTSGVTQGLFNSDICESTGVSRDQLLRILNKLKKLKIITKTIPGFNGSRSLKRLPSVYFFNRTYRFINSNRSSYWKDTQHLALSDPDGLSSAAESVRGRSYEAWVTWFNEEEHKLGSKDIFHYVANEGKRSLALILLDERKTLDDIDIQHILWVVMEAAELLLLREFRHSPGLIEQLREGKNPWQQEEGTSIREMLSTQLIDIFLEHERHYNKVSKIFLRIARQTALHKEASESSTINAAQSAFSNIQYEAESRKLFNSARAFLSEWLVNASVDAAYNIQRFITDEGLINTEKKNPQFGCRLLLTDSTNAEQSDVTLLLGEVDHSAPAKLAVHPLPPSHREPL